MRRLLSGSLMFAGMVYMPVSISQRQTQITPIPDYSTDPRLETLRKFFAKAGCPAMNYVKSFLEAADGYALDWRASAKPFLYRVHGGKARLE